MRFQMCMYKYNTLYTFRHKGSKIQISPPRLRVKYTSYLGRNLVEEHGPTKVHTYTPSLWKKPFCFSLPPENSHIKDQKSCCWYQKNLPATHRVFLNSPCQKSYGQKIPAKNYRYGRKIPAFWSLEGDFLDSHAWKVKAGKSQQATTDTTGKSRGK